jgi:hypothetical protein
MNQMARMSVGFSIYFYLVTTFLKKQDTMKAFVKAGFIIFLFNILTGCSNKTYPTGNFQETPVTVDGDLSEWNRPLRFGSRGGRCNIMLQTTGFAGYLYLTAKVLALDLC